MYEHYSKILRHHLFAFPNTHSRTWFPFWFEGMAELGDQQIQCILNGKKGCSFQNDKELKII